MAWFTAPAPIACTSARLCSRTTPAIAPATAVERDRAETLMISTIYRCILPGGSRRSHMTSQAVATRDEVGCLENSTIVAAFSHESNSDEQKMRRDVK